MIKKFILLITVLGSINSLYSQNIAKVDYHHFIVKNNHHYQIISDMNTNFDFYSDNSGGNYLRSVSTTSDFNTFHGFIDLPGLIVCKDPTKNKSVYGLVAHTTKPLFHLKQYNIIKLNKDIYISI